MKRRGKGRIWSGIAISLLFALLATACLRDELAWTSTYNFPAGIWEASQRVNFTPDTTLSDSYGKPMKGVVSIRYGCDSSVEAFPMVVECESPSKSIYRNDTVMVRLLAMRDRTADRGTVGVFETADTLPLNLEPAHDLTLTLYPAGEKTEIEGLISLTFELVKQ